MSFTVRSDLFLDLQTESSLNGFQLSCSQLFRGLKEEASNPLNLFGLTAGGALARAVELRCFKSLVSFSYGSRSYFSLFAPKLASFVGIMTEGSIFATLPMIQEKSPLSNGSTNIAHASLVIGLSRIVSYYTPAGFLLNCLAQDAVVMGVDVSFEKLSLRENQNLQWGERWVHARIVAFQMQMSGEICSWIPLVTHHRSLFEIEKRLCSSNLVDTVLKRRFVSPFSGLFEQTEFVTSEGVLFSRELSHAREEKTSYLYFNQSEFDEVCETLQLGMSGKFPKSQSDKGRKKNKKKEKQKEKEEIGLKQITDEMHKIALESYSLELREAYETHKQNKKNKVDSAEDVKKWRHLRKQWEVEQAQKIKSEKRSESDRAKVALVGSLIPFICRRTTKLLPLEGRKYPEAQAIREEFVREVLAFMFKYIEKFDPEKKGSALYITYGGRALKIVFPRFIHKVLFPLPIELPNNGKNSLIHKIREAQRALTKTVNGEEVRPTYLEIAKALKKSPNDIAEILNMIDHGRAIKLEDPVGEQNSASWSDVIGSEALTPEEEFVEAERRQKIEELGAIYERFYATLTDPIKKEVFKTRLLSQEESPSTLQEIADHYGLTRERVRQIEKQMIARLREYILKEGKELILD